MHHRLYTKLVPQETYSIVVVDLYYDAVISSNGWYIVLNLIEVFKGSFFERSFRPTPLRAGALTTMNELIDNRQQKPN